MSQYDDRPYEIGKGKPPIKNQFQPGVSGNPKGRRRKKKAVDASLPVLLQEALNEMVTVTINGRDMRVPKKQAIIIQTINDALTGTPTQRLKTMKVLHGIGAFDPDVFDKRPDPVSQEEAAYKLIEALIEEGKRDEATSAQFEHYELRYDPELGREAYHDTRQY
jgi:hypothetical protein